jgi:hypothetical protein
VQVEKAIEFIYNHAMKTLTAITVIWVLSVNCALARGTKICFEAESAEKIEVPMVLVSNGIENVSGIAISIPEKAGNPPERCEGAAVYTINIPKKGNYTLWCRVRWNGECSNSFTARFNDKPPILFGEDATYKVWHWVKYPVSRTSAPIALEAGKTIFKIENREDGIMVDQIILSTDKRFVPIEIEKTGVFN